MFFLNLPGVKSLLVGLWRRTGTLIVVLIGFTAGYRGGRG